MTGISERDILKKVSSDKTELFNCNPRARFTTKRKDLAAMRDIGLAPGLAQWLTQSSGMTVRAASLCEDLMNGVVLCTILKKIDKNAIGRFHKDPDASRFEALRENKRRENVANFTEGCKQLGITATFSTIDLVNEDLAKVNGCLIHLVKIADARGGVAAAAIPKRLSMAARKSVGGVPDPLKRSSVNSRKSVSSTSSKRRSKKIELQPEEEESEEEVKEEESEYEEEYEEEEEQPKRKSKRRSKPKAEGSSVAGKLFKFAALLAVMAVIFNAIGGFGVMGHELNEPQYADQLVQESTEMELTRVHHEEEYSAKNLRVKI